MTRTHDTANRNAADAHYIATHIEAATRSMHDNRGGYPSQTPGAGPATPAPPREYAGLCADLLDDNTACGAVRPCRDHDTPVHLTQPERDATSIDRAALDALALAKALRQAQAHLNRAATIVARWANPGDTKTAIERKLSGEGDRSIWCRNCAAQGVNNVAVEHRTECKFCAEFRRTWGSPPNRALLEIHANRNVTPQDAVRILDRDVAGWRKNAPKPKAGKVRQVAKGRAA